MIESQDYVIITYNYNKDIFVTNINNIKLKKWQKF